MIILLFPCDINVIFVWNWTFPYIFCGFMNIKLVILNLICMCLNVKQQKPCLLAKLLKRGHRYNFSKAFSKFYPRPSCAIVKCNLGWRTLLQQDNTEPVGYGDFVYNFKRIVGKLSFHDQFKKISDNMKEWDIAWVLCNSMHVWL